MSDQTNSPEKYNPKNNILLGRRESPSEHAIKAGRSVRTAQYWIPILLNAILVLWVVTLVSSLSVIYGVIIQKDPIPLLVNADGIVVCAPKRVNLKTGAFFERSLIEENLCRDLESYKYKKNK